MLTNQDNTFTKLVLFKQTLQIFSNLGTLTSMDVIVDICDKTEFAQYLRPLLANHDQNFTK